MRGPQIISNPQTSTEGEVVGDTQKVDLTSQDLGYVGMFFVGNSWHRCLRVPVERGCRALSGHHCFSPP